MNLDSEAFKNRSKAMDEEEKKMFLEFVPSDFMWDELQKRDLYQRQLISDAKNVFKLGEYNGSK